MNIFVSTVGRGKNQEESSKIYKIDLSSSNILASVKLPLAMVDLANPRGGCRGARGLCIHKGELWAAGYDGLFNLDKETLFVKKGFWSKDFKDIHQIYSHKEFIRGTATWTNEIFRFSTNSFKFQSHKNLTQIFKGIPNSTSPDTMHLNALSKDLALLCNLGKVVNWINPTTLYEGLYGSHDLISLPTGELAVNLSGQTITIAINLIQKTQRIIYKADPNVSETSEIAQHGFLRGLTYLTKTDQLLIGSSPAKVLVINSPCSLPKLTKTIEISDEVAESVFGIILEE